MNLVIGRFAGGGDQGHQLSLGEALARAWDYDAHFTQYEADRRLVKAMVAEHPMRMTCAVFDFDCPNHEAIADHPEMVDALERLPAGFCAYLTHGGFRAITLLPEPLTVDSPESWETWRSMHAGLGRALSDQLGVEFDPACSDPSRLFRLPNVVREGKEVYPELIGEMAVNSLAYTPAPRRAATEVSTGAAADSFLGAAFHTLGHVQQNEGEKLTVRCPWAHEHSDPSQDSAVVYADDTGLGKFHCGHSHCKGRGTSEVIEVYGTLPALAELRQRYLLDSGPAVVSNKPEIINEPKAEASKVTGFLHVTPASALAAPLGDIPWLVEALDFAPGRPMIVGGAAGSGKTYALQEMALSVAGGGLVWGAYSVNRTGPVLHIDVDQGQYATAMRYQLLARGRGIDLATLPLGCAFFNFAMSDKNGVNMDYVRALAKATQGHALCIIDSLRGIAPGLDEQDSAFGNVLQALTEVSAFNQCAFAVVAHSGHDQDRTRGTSAILDRAGTVYQLQLHKGEDGTEGYVQWEQKKRSEYARGEFKRFRTVMDRTPDGLNERTTIRVPDAAPRGERPEEVIQKLMLEELEKSAAKGLKQADLLHCVTHIQKRKEVKLECLRDLETKKSVVKVGAGQGARYYLGTRLPDQVPSREQV